MVAVKSLTNGGTGRHSRRKRPSRPKKATLLVEEDEVLEVDARKLVISADLYDELFQITKTECLSNGMNTIKGKSPKYH
ncbi:hypothetical protein V1521DRAFT_92288 [Lipomyces starkeyi]